MRAREVLKARGDLSIPFPTGYTGWRGVHYYVFAPVWVDEVAVKPATRRTACCEQDEASDEVFNRRVRCAQTMTSNQLAPMYQSPRA
jgi:hypothetical protein